MDTQQIDHLLASQRQFFQSGATLPVSRRIAALKRLRGAIQAHEADIAAALQADLGKSAFESYMCETGMVLGEINYMLRRVRRFARRKIVPSPLSQFPSVSFRQPSPYGSVLIMSPWNYPFLLTISPLVDALAAGNVALIKPSAYAPATSAVIERLIALCFPPEHVSVVTGGRRENTALLEKKFDLVFFTGSQHVGREVLRHTAEHLTPAVLELGGKSPCIVDETADIPLAAKRIVFGKFLNCGQTCVAPDYILCQRGIEEQLVQELVRQIKLQFGENPLQNPDYGRIVSRKHFDRLCALIDEGKLVCGNLRDGDALRLSPTVLRNVSWDDPVMQEEIFGPILPVLVYDTPDEVISLLSGKPKPLALYIFSQDKGTIRTVTERVSFGGGCINDVVIHLAGSHLGFGGVGESGMGSYHGRDGFNAFSHVKNMLDKKTWLDIPARYQPYTKAHEKVMRLVLK